MMLDIWFFGPQPFAVYPFKLYSIRLWPLRRWLTLRVHFKEAR